MNDKRPSPIHQQRHPELGEQITRARLQRGYVRSKVAEQINVNPGYYNRIEHGIVMPPLVVFASIWRCLQFEPRAVLEVLPIQYSEPTKRTVPLRDELLAYSSKIGRMLARARVDANLTPEALANAIGVRARHIARIESGHALPSLQRFAHLHRVLDLDVERILGRLLGDIPDQPFRRLGNMLRSARRARQSLTLHDAAQAIGCEPSHYRRLEYGEFLPSTRELALIHKLIRYDANAAMQWLWACGQLNRRR